MKTKYERIKDNTKRIIRLKDATILKYSEEIDYDDELSLYDVMMEHFAEGELDSAFLTSITKGMSKEEKKKLFDMVRPYVGLYFAKGDVDYWLESVENASLSDYEFIAATIFDNYNYLLELARDGGLDVLNQLVALKENNDLRDQAVIQYLRDSFVDDRALKAVLFAMAEPNSEYNMFSDEQKGTLLNYPEGTLYSYGEGKIRITSPYILGSRMFNDFNRYISSDLIGAVNASNLGDVTNALKNFFADDSFNFEDTVLDLSARYRDYMVQNDVILNDEVMDVVYDTDGRDIQVAWNNGDGILGSSYEIPYVGGTK